MLKPLINPHRPPTTSAVKIITKIELVILKATIVALVVKTSADPIERSICPVMITRAMPRAIVPTIHVF